MNGSLELVKQFKALQPSEEVQIVIFPPFPYLSECTCSWAVGIGAQNVNGDPANGAQTGEVSLQMLKEFKVLWVLIGHSERRNIFNEDDQV